MAPNTFHAPAADLPELINQLKVDTSTSENHDTVFSPSPPPTPASFFRQDLDYIKETEMDCPGDFFSFPYRLEPGIAASESRDIVGSPCPVPVSASSGARNALNQWERDLGICNGFPVVLPVDNRSEENPWAFEENYWASEENHWASEENHRLSVRKTVHGLSPNGRPYRPINARPHSVGLPQPYRAQPEISTNGISQARSGRIQNYTSPAEDTEPRSRRIMDYYRRRTGRTNRLQNRDLVSARKREQRRKHKEAAERKRHRETHILSFVNPRAKPMDYSQCPVSRDSQEET